MSLFGDVLGGIIQGDAAKKAAKTQRQTTQDIIAANERVRQQTFSLERPTINRGDAAGALYGAFLGLPSQSTQGSRSGKSGTVDWGAYVNDNPWALDHWNKIKGTKQARQFGDDVNAFGQYHYGQYGNGWNLDPYTYGGQSGPAPDAKSALATFRNSTGYQDLLDTGLAAINANAYARGTGDSGATLKALQTKGMALADQSAQGWLGNLGNLMNLGQTAIGNVSGTAVNLNSQSNQARQGAADATGNAALIKGNVWGNVGRSGVDLLASLGSSFGG